MCLGQTSSSSVPVPPAFFRGNYASSDINADTNVVDSRSCLDQDLNNDRDLDKADNQITAKAKEIAAYYTADERAMAETIYGEARGKPYEDKVGVGWTMRARKDRYPDLTYKYIAGRWYAPLNSLSKANDAELQAWAESFRAARDVQNADTDSNPIPGVTHFYDPSIPAPPWTKGATKVQYGSGSLLFYKGVKWSK